MQWVQVETKKILVRHMGKESFHRSGAGLGQALERGEISVLGDCPDKCLDNVTQLW